MLCIGQERKAGLCCYAGVCYKNTTLRFQSRNTEQAPVPPSSCRTGSVAEGLGPQNPQGQGRCRRLSQRRAGGHTGPQEIPVGLNTAAQQPRCPLPLISLLLLPPNQINHHGGLALRRARAPPWQAARPPAAGPLAQPRPAGLGPPGHPGPGDGSHGHHGNPSRPACDGGGGGEGPSVLGGSKQQQAVHVLKV